MKMYHLNYSDQNYHDYQYYHGIVKMFKKYWCTSVVIINIIINNLVTIYILTHSLKHTSKMY